MAIEIKDIDSDLTEVADNIFIDSERDRDRYSMWLGNDIAVTKEGFTKRNSLAAKLFQDEKVSRNWSEEGLLELLDNAIRAMGGQIKKSQDVAVEKIAKELLGELDNEFEERYWYLPVIGLKVDNQLELGNITFHPFEEKIKELESHTAGSYSTDLSEHRDSIASAKYAVEPRRASELLREDIEYSLNILRYLGALIWFNRPDRRVALAGEQRTISYAVSFEDDKDSYEISEARLFVIPFTINNETIEYAKFHGLEHFQELTRRQNLDEIEEKLLLAVQWFGAARKEVQPLFAFLKFYVPQEILLKKITDRAKSSIPPRLSTLFYPYKPRGKEALEMMSDLEEIICERNEVAHSGKPKKRRIENLRYLAERYSIETINQVRRRMLSENLQTQADLFNWIKSQRRFIKSLYKGKPTS